MQSIDLNVVLSFCAVIVSVISLVSSIVFSRLQIEHNKNSVRPVSWIRVKDYEDDIAVIIQNVGIGPLKIKRLRFHNDDGVYPDLISMVRSIDQNWTTFVWTADGWTLPVNGELFLLEWKPAGKELSVRDNVTYAQLDEKEIKAKLRAVLSKTTVLLDYTDIFGTEFHDQRKLDFFGRLLYEVHPESRTI